MRAALSARRAWLGRAFVIALLVNAVALGFFLWSRGGSSTTVRIAVSGDTFTAWVDGKLYDSATYDVDRRGGVGFALTAGKGIPSLPGPSAIRSLRVTDATTGAVLFEDSFRNAAQSRFVRQGSWTDQNGAFWSPTGGEAGIYRPWRDYVLEARFTNLVSATLLVRLQRNHSAIAFFFRPYRDFDSGFYVRKGLTPMQPIQGPAVEVNGGQTSRSILDTALRPYPTFLLVVLAAVVAIVGTALVGKRLEFVQRFESSIRLAARPIAAGLALGAFGVLAAINWVFVGRMPHVPDEVAYLFQAKIFASGHLYLHPPAAVESFDFFPGMLIADHGRWFSQYPFGHPLVLAVGELVHAPWLIPPIVGALTVYGLYRLGRHLYGPLIGLLAALPLLVSPFFQMTASNFMSHNTAALSLVAATLFLLRPTRRPRLSWFLSGLLLGFLLNIRPLSAAGLFVVFVGWLAIEVRAAAERRLVLQRSACWLAGFGVMVAAFLAYDRLLTGSFLKTPYSYSGTSQDVGFSATHSLAAGLSNTETNLSLLVLVLDGWPLFVGLLLPLLPFLLGSRRRDDYFLAAAVLVTMAVYTAYKGVYIMHGPRFWYETTPFLVLLSARGIQRFVEAVGGVGEWLNDRQIVRRPLNPRPPAALLSALVLAALIAYSADGWTLGNREAWPPIQYVPRTMMELRGFNGADDRLLRRAQQERIHDAVIFVRDCGNWQCYGSVFWKNSLNLDGDIVWARDLGPQTDAQLMSSYSARGTYIADYTAGTISAWSPAA